MALSSNQTVRIVVVLDTNAAKRELERVHGQAQMAVQRKGGAAGTLRPGGFLRGGVRSGRAPSGMGRLVRSGLGRLAGKAMRGVGGRIGAQAGRVGAGLLARAGFAAGASATAASALVIGATVKMFLDNKFPQLGEMARKWSMIDKMLAWFSQQSMNAERFGQMEQAFADLGLKMPDSVALNDRLSRVSGFGVNIDAQRDAIQRRNLKRSRAEVPFDEYVRRTLLGTTFGQMVASAPDARAALLKMIGMRS